MMDARFESSAMKILESILKVVGFKISSQGNPENVGPWQCKFHPCMEELLFQDALVAGKASLQSKKKISENAAGDVCDG